MQNIIDILKKNWIIAGLGGLILILFMFPALFRAKRVRRRRRAGVVPVARRRRAGVRRALPRSVGVRRKPSGSGYPAAGGGTVPFKYNKDGSVKKAWQVGGTLAAKSRMKRLRSAR